MSIEFEFNDILAVAKGAEEATGLTTEKDIRTIRSALDSAIIYARLTNLSYWGVDVTTTRRAGLDLGRADRRD